MDSGINRRRALVEEALMMGGLRAFEKLQSAFAGASDEQRKALAQIVLPETLFTYEGPTPRACYLLLASESPAAAADQLVRNGPFHGDYSRLLLGAVGRTPEWICAFVAALPNDFIGWGLQREVLRQSKVKCSSVSYLRAFVSNGNRCTYYVDRPVESLCDFFRNDPDLLNHELIVALSTPGIVDEITRFPEKLDTWVQAIVQLASKDSQLRNRVLDATLKGLFRGVSKLDSALHIAVHEALDPTAEEVAARVREYCLLMSQGLHGCIELGQTMLRRNLGACPSESLLAASHDVFELGEALLMRRQLGLLREWALITPTRTQKICSVMRKLAKRAPHDVRDYIDRVDGPCANEPAGEKLRIPTPKAKFGTTMYEHTAPLPSIEERQFATFVSHIFGQFASGTELQCVIDYLGGRPGYEIPAELAAKARAFPLYEDSAAPRVQLARLLSSCDDTENQFAAKQAYGRLHYDDYQWEYIETNAPIGVLGALFQHVWEVQHQGVSYRTVTPFPRQHRAWELDDFRPEKLKFSQLDTISTGLVWRGIGDAPVPGTAPIEERIFDTMGMFNDYQDRALEALISRDAEIAMDWAAWLLQHNLDTLAALAHPAALVAGMSVNAFGLQPVLQALATVRRPLVAPEYSLLALTSCALHQHHRYVSAQTLAAWALSGVFKADFFADQVATLWSLGLIRPARLAATLADAAQINAISGYRILQAVERILNDCEDIGESETLLRLAAMLSLDYGTPISLPDTIVNVVDPPRAISVLAAVNPRETKLARAAAVQAQ